MAICEFSWETIGKGEQNARWGCCRFTKRIGREWKKTIGIFLTRVTYKGGSIVMPPRLACHACVWSFFREIINVCRQKWVEKNSSKSSSLCCVETILMVDEKPLGYNTNIPPWFDVNQHISNLLLVKFFQIYSFRKTLTAWSRGKSLKHLSSVRCNLTR